MNKKTKKNRLYTVQRILKSNYDKYGVPGEIRTPDPRLRRALLYPAELLGPIIFSDIFYYNYSEIKSQHSIIEKLRSKEESSFPPLIRVNWGKETDGPTLLFLLDPCRTLSIDRHFLKYLK